MGYVFIILFILCVYTCHGAHVEVREQLKGVGSGPHSGPGACTRLADLVVDANGPSGWHGFHFSQAFKSKCIFVHSVRADLNVTSYSSRAFSTSLSLLQGLVFCVAVNTYKHDCSLRCKMNPFPPSLPPCVLWDVWPAHRFSYQVLGFCCSGAGCLVVCLHYSTDFVLCSGWGGGGAEGPSLLSRKPELDAVLEKL